VKRAALLAVIVAALAPAGASAFQLRIFHTPGGNIGCSLIYGRDSGGGGVRCDIAHHSWKSPPKPKWCDVDYGNGLNVGAHRKARFVCAGDTVLHQGRKLAVDRVMKLGPYKCKSLSGAVRCVNRDTKHGFKLSRTVVKRF
jgi:Family of unknown function (DUF6636)